MKRKADVAGRRRLLCDVAIEILALEGGRGLSHRKVEQRAGLPDGTTSSYFRTRSALLRATAERVAELDAADFVAVTGQAAGSGATLAMLADMVMQSATGPALDRSRARYELALHSQRDDVLRGAFTDAIAGFVALSEQAVTSEQPEGAMAPELIEEQARVVTTFINGVMVRQILGDNPVGSAEELTHLLHALIAGIAASHHLRAVQP
jgi:DNA-binding transcriptional regulator YbjK